MSNDEIVRPAIILNGRLRDVNQAVLRTGLTPREQISICVLATALAFRRLIEVGHVHGHPLQRGERMRLIKAMVADFENKIRNYGEGDLPEGEAAQPKPSQFYWINIVNMIETGGPFDNLITAMGDAKRSLSELNGMEMPDWAKFMVITQEVELPEDVR